ncbi:uncharacterized protein LOC132942890 isoform X1 [Metopolophium dirhodum]|uniref:uncharacterized protein LOC132942890 isoform X1 n=1 Tax=Metopolophium dirhodum TaxID=44670 RepID=UPI0029901EE9|nr:uncharacterized protein LOC132942890 isoform X1 [Metopolophium dirhodum]
MEDLRRYLYQTLTKVEGLYSILISDHDGVVILKAHANKSSEHNSNYKHSFLSEFNSASEQAGKLELGKNKTVICFYTNNQYMSHQCHSSLGLLFSIKCGKPKMTKKKLIHVAIAAIVFLQVSCCTMRHDDSMFIPSLLFRRDRRFWFLMTDKNKLDFIICSSKIIIIIYNQPSKYTKMVNGCPCQYGKDNATKIVSENKIQFQQLNDIFSLTSYLTAYDQKTLSKKLKIDEKDIRLLFRKKRAQDKKDLETERKADISTTVICNNDRVPHHPHLLHGLYHGCHFSAEANHSI